MSLLMSFAMEPEIVTLAWIDNVSVQFPLNIYATRGFKNRRKSRSRRGNEAEVFFAPKSASYCENEI